MLHAMNQNSKPQHIQVFYCDGSRREKGIHRKREVSDYVLRSVSSCFYTQVYFIETPHSKNHFCDPADPKFRNMVLIFVFYVDKCNIRDTNYRLEILRCILRHQHIVILNGTCTKNESVLAKFRGATAWERDQLRLLLEHSVILSKHHCEDDVSSLIGIIKDIQKNASENQEHVNRKKSILGRRSSSASKLLDCVKLEELPQSKEMFSSVENSKGNAVSFFRRISHRNQESKAVKSSLWGHKRYQADNSNRNFLFGHFSGTLKRKSKKPSEHKEISLKDSLSRTRVTEFVSPLNSNTNKTFLSCSDVFEVRGTEVNLEKRLTRRPWDNWKSKFSSKLEKQSASYKPNKTSEKGIEHFIKTSERGGKAFEFDISSPRSAPTSPPSSSESISADGNGVSGETSGHDIIRVGTLNRSGSCHSLPHITVTHSAAPAATDGTVGLVEDDDFLPRVSCIEDFEHFSTYAIFRPERSRRRSSQKFLIIRYPEDLSMLQKRDSNSEIASSVCSSPNPYDALELTTGYDSESPLQSPETRRSIYPQPVPAFSVESCFPPIEIPKTVQGV